MITFIGLESPIELENIVQQYFSQHELWNAIVETEKELYEFRSTMAEGENKIIAYKIMDGTEVLGLIQYRHAKGRILKKEEIVINLLTLIAYSPEVIRGIHQALMQKYNLSDQLIHTITKAEEGDTICQQLKQEGFTEHRNRYKNPKYGYEAGALYFVKKI